MACEIRAFELCAFSSLNDRNLAANEARPSGSRGLRPPPENFSRKKRGYSSLTPTKEAKAPAPGPTRLSQWEPVA